MTMSLENFRNWYRSLPDKKRYLEFFTALLTVPVLLTVVATNVINLQNMKKRDEQANTTPTPTVIVNSTPVATPAPTTTATPGPTEACRAEVGPVSIQFPTENQTVDQNPVCLDISYKTGEYCAVVWSYRINNSTWSDYNDKSICLYNLPPGEKRLDLRVKSIASGDEIILTRDFTVAGSSPSPSASPSATQ
jgi:hypothetical protein